MPRKSPLHVVQPSPRPPLSAEVVPEHLSAEAGQLWCGYTTTWAFDHAGLVLLLVTLEAFDMLRSGQAEIARDGLLVGGKAHPAAAVVKDARIALFRGLRQLGLDVIPPEPRVGRPNGRG